MVEVVVAVDAVPVQWMVGAGLVSKSSTQPLSVPEQVQVSTDLDCKVIRRKATENIYTGLRIQHRSVIYIRDISSWCQGIQRRLDLPKSQGLVVVEEVRASSALALFLL